MIATSSEGAPTPRSPRLAGLHWLALAIPAIVVLGVSVWITLSFGVGAAAFGLILLAALCGAAVPVRGAGLLRGSEERHARIESRRELTPRQ